MRYNRIIMFCDYGLDDAIATLHILKNADMFAKIDIVPIGGNVSVHTAYRNAHTLLHYAKADKTKVRIIDTREIEQYEADIPDIHGEDGIGDVLKPEKSDLEVVSFADYKAEIERNADPAHDCVLSVGPCTVPNMLGYVPFCTVLMGGTVGEQPNYGEYEFNEACDVKAFGAFAYKAAAVATLDTCHDKGFGFDTFTMNDPLADSLINKYREMCNSRDAFVTVYDYVAALAVTNPELFDVTRIKRPDGVEFNQLKLKK
ncbi:MAG: nucleoside hydrolase [Clostridiales bacterium]|nr:nucleoside hydrolase [Clostridiales bacterium]